MGLRVESDTLANIGIEKKSLVSYHSSSALRAESDILANIRIERKFFNIMLPLYDLLCFGSQTGTWPLLEKKNLLFPVIMLSRSQVPLENIFLVRSNVLHQ